MRGLSVAGMSVLFAVGLALWEIYFFWFAGSFPSLNAALGLFTTERLGFNMAWIAAIYLTFQLISIPFALPTATGRFIGVVDGMASLLPLAVVLVAVFGKPHLIETGAAGRRPFCSSSSLWSICSADTRSTSRSAAGLWMLRRPEIRPGVCLSVTSRH
jgi:hypothetical protein